MGIEEVRSHTGTIAYDVPNIVSYRKGGLRGLKERLANEIMFDYGTRLHESAGASVIGVRDPLIAYNVTLDSPGSIVS